MSLPSFVWVTIYGVVTTLTVSELRPVGGVVFQVVAADPPPHSVLTCAKRCNMAIYTKTLTLPPSDIISILWVLSVLPSCEGRFGSDRYS
jgi:hypothetical protein